MGQELYQSVPLEQHGSSVTKRANLVFEPTGTINTGAIPKSSFADCNGIYQVLYQGTGVFRIDLQSGASLIQHVDASTWFTGSAEAPSVQVVSSSLIPTGSITLHCRTSGSLTQAFGRLDVTIDYKGV